MSNLKTIVVTGGAGHIGSHLIELLVADPTHRVISLDNYSNGREENHVAGAEYRRGHTRDVDRLVPETPAILYHLGEYARISSSFDEPQVVHDSNMIGTFAIAEFCRLRRVEKLVYAASSTKFAQGGNGRNESPYAFTKASNVDLINNYGRWYDVPYAICYFYNAFGPREVGTGGYATVIAKFETQYRAGETLTVVKPGTQRRAFTYVGDLARGIALVGEKGCGDGYALGTSKTYSILEIAEAFGIEYELIDGRPGRMESMNDPTLARGLGWEATVDVMDYIREFRQRHPWGGG